MACLLCWLFLALLTLESIAIECDDAGCTPERLREAAVPTLRIASAFLLPLLAGTIGLAAGTLGLGPLRPPARRRAVLLASYTAVALSLLVVLAVGVWLAGS